MRQERAGLVRSVVLAVVFTAATAAVRADVLADHFASPPPSARPWVYWMGVNGNLTREGITADLESMARVGIGGALYLEVSKGAPAGPVDFAGAKWRELFSHACREAERLGLELNVNNSAGWCGSGGPWITPEFSMQKVVWSETVVAAGQRFTGRLPQPKALRGFYRDIAVLAFPSLAGDRPGSGKGYRIENIEFKALYALKHPRVPAGRAEWPAAPAEATIRSAHIVDLSASMQPDGALAWTAPAESPSGSWTILRFGHTTTGTENHPAPKAGLGLESDKLCKRATALAFEGLMAKLLAENRPLVGTNKVLVSTHIDSWETGAQNWTARMREEFKARRGYELLKYLPVYTGRVVESLETSERFLWDLRQTVSDLLVENYAGEFCRLANAHGIRLSIEAYNGPSDDMAYGGQADEPMSEFWAWKRFGASGSCARMSSAAHTYGKRILAAEVFTSWNDEKWQGHPGNIKDLGDWALCEGINRFVFHRFAAQPWLDRVPGMSMGPFGLHYERTQTWWEYSKPWHEYLARCQYLLRQGLFVADLAYLHPEGVPRKFEPPAGAEIAPHVRGGYNYDGCSVEVLLTRMSVDKGRLILPDGMSYRALVLADEETMTLPVLRKVAELAEKGATIIGARPPVKSPSLSEMGEGDRQVQALARTLWESGRIITGKKPMEVLAQAGVKPDFTASAILRYTHRTTGAEDIYFVANPEPGEVTVNARFRVSGRVPEFWNPDSGTIRPVAEYTAKDDVTTIPLRLDPHGSVFVVFRNRSQESGVRSQNTEKNFPEFKLVQEISGPWEVQFDPEWYYGRDGARVTSNACKVVFERLEDWTKRPEDGIRYFSGKAVYSKAFDWPRASVRGPLYLDLGAVKDLAGVRLNGRDLGVLWKRPCRVEITEVLRQGENTLEVEVVNLWLNRMIGDERLAEDSERKKGELVVWPQWLKDGKPSPSGRRTFTTWRLCAQDDPLLESGLLGPVTIKRIQDE